MVKRVGKRAVVSLSKERMPNLDTNHQKMSFKECKRRSILSGLRMLKAPAVIALLVNSLFSMPSLKWGPQYEIEHLELFAGDCSVTRGEFEEGRTSSIAMDVAHDPTNMDMLTSSGFVAACYHATCIRPGGGLLAAPVCSSFVFMNSGTSGRSQSRPLGREEFQSVANGNILCARTLVILWICAALQIWWIVEQPQGSFMEHHPCFQHVLALLDVHRHRMTMGSYGGSSEKPTWLYSCKREISELAQFRPATTRVTTVALVDRYLDGSGRMRIKGNKFLKASQSYPLGFGRALARLRSRHQVQNRRDAIRLIKANAKSCKGVKRNTRKDALWIRCANLKPVFDFLS